MTAPDFEPCRHRGSRPIGFMSHTIPVCWQPKGHAGPHATSYGAVIEGGDDD